MMRMGDVGIGELEWDARKIRRGREVTIFMWKETCEMFNMRGYFSILRGEEQGIEY
jgi:hypothetical protein